MTESHRCKEKSGSNNEEPRDDFLEGTSARTRPFSFSDVMARRKNREDATKQVTSDPGVADVELARDGKAVHSPEFHRQIHEHSGTMEMKHTSSDPQKVSSRRKGESDASRKNDKLVLEKDKGSRDSHAKSRSTGDKNASSNRVTEAKSERRYHSNRKKGGFVSDDSDHGSDKRKIRDSVKKDRVSERSREKSEVDRKQLHNDDRQVSRKRRNDERMSSDSENEHKKRNARDLKQTEKLIDRDRDKSEKENRHKRHNEEDKTRGRSGGKKHDSDKKGPELTRANLEESKLKRRRSRSREREKERGRRSRSHSPKVHKHTSKDKKEHGELSTKDGSGREHSGFDKKKVSSNGSSSHYRRTTGSSSGLGGYSPRKRKTDAAAKTPSPTRRSPERRTAGWDLQPVEKESTVASSTLPNMHTTSQSLLLNIKELPSGNAVMPTMPKAIGNSYHALSSQMYAIESIQLTQATRPMRRLYVENLPSSATEKDLIECINQFLLSSGANYIQGTQPCISCIIHKEKGQALLEFLTPEDASVALSFGGISFSGSNLKLRRPKDYANVTTGLPEKSVVAVDSISGTVEDSPHKIFIGGIPKLISSQMILEIARAFGPVKSFHYEFLADINKPCAFLEYVDHSVTSKACAGLNGMRLGGKVVTAVFATPDAVLENVGKKPFYGVPEHAKSLLEKPTAVLKLKNVLDPEGLLSFSESKLEEILDDIRLESSRFGTVKSVNVVKQTKSSGAMNAYEVENINVSANGCNSEFENRSHVTERLDDSVNEFGEPDRSEIPETPNDSEANIQKVEDNSGLDNTADTSKELHRSVEPEDVNRSRDSLSNETAADNLINDEISKPPSDDGTTTVEDPSSQETSDGLAGDLSNQKYSSVNDMQSNDNIAGPTYVGNTKTEEKPSIEEELKLQENNVENVSPVELESDERKESDASKEESKKDTSIDLDSIFEPGSVFVEYKRDEAACMAAHCLHGRIFDGRVVTVGYVSHDLYQKRFRR